VHLNVDEEHHVQSIVSDGGYISFTRSIFEMQRCQTIIAQTNSEVNISHETTTMVVWIYNGI